MEFSARTCAGSEMSSGKKCLISLSGSFGLFPLALNGGPLWEPLCYAQIGGLVIANYLTKLLVQALYAICVLDPKIVKWETESHGEVVLPLSANEA